MIRWYDWILAVLLADLILANIIMVFVIESILFQILGSLAVTLLIDLWSNIYCKFRFIMEKRNG